MHASSWISVEDKGLYVSAGGFYIDPVRPVEKALITHGHADHARPGHRSVLATRQTIDIMQLRYGENAAEEFQSVEYGEVLTVGSVTVTFIPAGHVLGSAQIVLEYKGQRVIASGDYKRRSDPTCATFEPMVCDVFITEATFGLPVFKHPETHLEITKLLKSLKTFPDRTHLIGCYALGKCQRLIAEIRAGGYQEPIYLHGALLKLTEYYQSQNIDLGELIPVSQADKNAFAGKIVLAPPGAIADKWSRRFGDAVVGLASGWMTIKQRARQRGIELPLIISDHADWPELLQTIEHVQAGEIWVTHGREDALVHTCRKNGLQAQALSLIGLEEEDD